MYVDNQPTHENRTTKPNMQLNTQYFFFHKKIALCLQEKPSASSEMTNAIQFIHSEMSSSLLAVSGYWTEENGHSSF